MDGAAALDRSADRPDLKLSGANLLLWFELLVSFGATDWSFPLFSGVRSLPSLLSGVFDRRCEDD